MTLKKYLTARADLVIVAAFVVGFLVRAWAFGSIPAGLNQDEASTAYDAFSLIHYGVDRIGFPFPVVLVSWGSGMYAFASYIAAPFIGLFGLSIFTARLPHLLFGLMDLIIFPLLLLKLTDKWTARAGALLLAVMPWHIMISRWGLDSNLFPSLFLLGAYCMVIAKNKPWTLMLSALFFGLSLYAYGTAYVAVPVFLLLASVYNVIRKQWPMKYFLWSGGIFIVLALPIALFIAINKFDWPSIVTPIFSIPHLTGTPRYETTGNIHLTDPQFFVNLWKNLADAGRLLMTQDDGLPWNAISGYGVMYLFALPIAILGFLHLCEETIRKKNIKLSLLFFWCIAAIVLCAFVSVNINRINVALFPLIACVALGIAYFRKHSFVIYPVAALYLISFVSFIGTYFGSYPAQIGPAFFDGLVPAIAYAAEETNETICVTDNVNMPYIFALFANKEDPRLFAETVEYNNPGAEFQSVKKFGRFAFGLNNCTGVSVGAYVIRMDEVHLFADQNIPLEHFNNYLVLIPSPQ